MYKKMENSYKESRDDVVCCEVVVVSINIFANESSIFLFSNAICWTASCSLPEVAINFPKILLILPNDDPTNSKARCMLNKKFQ